ncbi:MAG: hypothetical protein OXC80_05595 [Gammaproteobacteria bacterium]|nr:hypothetical protein [Gammaproteobacteria bacterium]
MTLHSGNTCKAYAAQLEHTRLLPMRTGNARDRTTGSKSRVARHNENMSPDIVNEDVFRGVFRGVA